MQKLKFHLQLSKQLGEAVAAASLPVTPPGAKEDPDLEAFGQVVKSGLKKFPKDEWMDIQCQVLAVFKYKEKSAKPPENSGATV